MDALHGHTVIVPLLLSDPDIDYNGKNISVLLSLPYRQMDNDDRAEYYEYMAKVSHDLHQQARNNGYTDEDIQEDEVLYNYLNNMMENFGRQWRQERGFD